MSEETEVIFATLAHPESDPSEANEYIRTGLDALARSEESGRAEDIAFDALVADVLDELGKEAPEAVLDLALASLRRSAALMEEIVEETWRDLIEFKIRSKEIDRKQAETRAILAQVVGRI